MSGTGTSPVKEPVRLERLDGGAIWRVVLNTPKANIVDMEKTERLSGIFQEAHGAHALKAIVLDAAGPHFSFGASVEEHLPGLYEKMIPGFHRLFDVMLESAVTTVCAVRGQCLGGGLELATFCHRVFAAPDARLGQPEIKLGVFAPVASVILAERVGRGAAEELCLTGRSYSAEEALRVRLVDAVVDDPGQAALDWVREHLSPLSASSLRQAVRAVRAGFAARYRREIAVVERMYLDELMNTRDAQEGLRAFLDKRRPEWSDA